MVVNREALSRLTLQLTCVDYIYLPLYTVIYRALNQPGQIVLPIDTFIKKLMVF